MFAKNEIYESRVTGFTSQGAGVCRIGGRAVFVPGALPEELWQVRIVKATRTSVWGRGEKLLERSPLRREPVCPVFGKCGGCAAMHMDYRLELTFKRNRVNDALRRIGGLDIQAERIIAAPEKLGYRNKAIYNFAPGPVCGFYRARSHDVVAVDRCYLQHEVFDRAAGALLTWMKKTGTPAYNEATGKGLIRHLFLRRTSTHFIACIVAAGKTDIGAVQALRRECPELTGVLACENTTPGNVALAGPIRLLWGCPTVDETLCGAKLSLSPLTFFQVNTAQTEVLYRLAGQFAEPAGKTVLDLYCGAGAIGLAVARDAARLIGSDIVPEAVENARQNAVRNGVQNARYICGDAADAAKRLAAEGLQPDVIITDPPRKGMDESVLDVIAAMGPERLVYVSCDPGTLARDLKRLTERGYIPRRCVAVDMFPRTCHVETVVLLRYQNPHGYVHAVYATQPGDAPPPKEVHVEWEPDPGSYEIPEASYRRSRLRFMNITTG